MSHTIDQYDPDYYQMKWTCGGHVGGKMFSFGGETLSDKVANFGNIDDETIVLLTKFTTSL